MKSNFKTCNKREGHFSICLYNYCKSTSDLKRERETHTHKTGVDGSIAPESRPIWNETDHKVILFRLKLWTNIYILIYDPGHQM